MIERIKTGIAGLDDMIEGGFPKASVNVVIGSCGTGKSTMGIQYIYNGLINGEPGVYISLEEGEDKTLAMARDTGFELDKYAGKDLIILDISASDIRVSIERIRSELPDLIRSFKAKRFVIDSITLLEALFNSESERRSQLFNICKLIGENDATALFTSECDMSNPIISKYGLIEYVADGVISLRYIRPEDTKKVKLVLEVVKMRGTKHSRDIKPYSITEDGIIVYSESEVF
ncbi:MAG: KaiC domain-containing protein [Halobacteriota archaeon]|nr:KaiC domain-containing protein [Halobacteriota archaeon]